MTLYRLEADPVGALLLFLKSDPNVRALVGDRIYVPELLAATADIMPVSCIVMHRSGGTGIGSNSDVPLRHQRLDIKCYGPTAYESLKVYLALHGALKGLHSEVVDTTYLYAALEDVGPMDMREEKPEDWPFTFSVWLIMSNEIEIGVR